MLTKLSNPPVVEKSDGFVTKTLLLTPDLVRLNIYKSEKSLVAIVSSILKDGGIVNSDAL